MKIKKWAAHEMQAHERQAVKAQKLAQGHQIALPVFSTQENQRQYRIDQPSKRGFLHLYAEKESAGAESQRRVQSLEDSICTS